jgi:PLP dependent protein
VFAGRGVARRLRIPTARIETEGRLRRPYFPRVRIAAVASAELIRENLQRVKERVRAAAERAGRREEDVTLVAVTKTFPTGVILAAYEAGLQQFGENRVQEFEAKHRELPKLDAVWHLIGHLQSNKARKAVQLFDRIDSVDSGELARKVDAQVGALLDEHNGPGATVQKKTGKLPVLIEVHLGGEETKTGVAEKSLPELAAAISSLPHLELSGLMAIPPFFEDSEKVRPHFRKLRELRDQLSQHLGRALSVLSMGMSHDFEVAVEEGATEIRLGTALFGERTRQL